MCFKHIDPPIQHFLNEQTTHFELFLLIVLRRQQEQLTSSTITFKFQIKIHDLTFIVFRICFQNVAPLCYHFKWYSLPLWYHFILYTTSSRYNCLTKAAFISITNEFLIHSLLKGFAPDATFYVKYSILFRGLQAPGRTVVFKLNNQTNIVLKNKTVRRNCAKEQSSQYCSSRIVREWEHSSRYCSKRIVQWRAEEYS